MNYKFIKPGDIIFRNHLTLASVLFHMYLNYFKTAMQDNNSYAMLPDNLKVPLDPGNVDAVDSSTVKGSFDNNQALANDEKNLIMKGLYTEAQMSQLFTRKQVVLTEMAQTMLQAFTDFFKNVIEKNWRSRTAPFLQQK